MDILISAANLRFHQSAASVLAFSDSRKLGATYHFYNARWYLGTGIYTHNDLNEIGDGKETLLFLPAVPYGEDRAVTIGCCISEGLSLSVPRR